MSHQSFSGPSITSSILSHCDGGVLLLGGEAVLCDRIGLGADAEYDVDRLFLEGGMGWVIGGTYNSVRWGPIELILRDLHGLLRSNSMWPKIHR